MSARGLDRAGKIINSSTAITITYFGSMSVRLKTGINPDGSYCNDLTN
jgi:hypothetical protein